MYSYTISLASDVLEWGSGGARSLLIMSDVKRLGECQAVFETDTLEGIPVRHSVKSGSRVNTSEQTHRGML